MNIKTCQYNENQSLEHRSTVKSEKVVDSKCTSDSEYVQNIKHIVQNVLFKTKS
jgi:hypothetical protein